MTQGLGDTLEVILFDEGELNTLKQAVQQLYDHTINPQQIRTLIFNSHVRMLNDLKFFLTQYYKGNEKTRQFNNNKNNGNQDPDPSKSNALSFEIMNELREKNELLEIVGGRLHKIYAKMKEKHMNSFSSPHLLSQSLLKIIKETHPEANKAYTDARYNDFIRLKFKILEKWIELFYDLIIMHKTIKNKEMELSDQISEIETVLKISFQFKKGFDYWRITRNGIVHKDEKSDLEQAEKAKKYFDYAEKECAHYYVLYG